MAQKSKVVIIKQEVVYNREQELAKKHPEFKPGNTPSCKVGDEVLNGNVNWLQTLGEILATGQFTLSALSQEVGMQAANLARVLENDLQFLTFKAGAHLLAVYEKVVVGPRLG